MVLDDHILVDYDGNKPGSNAPTLKELEAALGESLPLPFQMNQPGTSLHFVYKLPAGVDPTTLRQSCDGGWLSGVDIKRGNQLAHIKNRGSDGTAKYQNYAALENAPEAPLVIIEALCHKAKPDSFPAGAETPLLADTERTIEALGHLDPGCDRSAWRDIGFALKALYQDDDSTGYQLFESWSAGEYWPAGAPSNYVGDGPGSTADQWPSFKAEGKIKPATLFYKAIEAGWRPPASFDTAAAFGASAAPMGVFDGLVDRVRESAGDIKQTHVIIEEIQAAGCSAFQVARLAAELKNALRDAGIKDKTVEAHVDKLLATNSTIEPIYVDESTGARLRRGSPVMGPNEQQRHFRGCVYIRSRHRVLIPNGDLLKPEQFNVDYGGYASLITKDGKTTRKAFEAFTESQLLEFARADATCFRPELLPGQIIEDGGRRLANTFVPAMGAQVPGDVSPILHHVAVLLPSGVDQELFLSYLAACAQMVGTKFQWCPVLQGVEGNGKTIFYRALTYALGERYTHLPNAADITNRFNGWIENKLLIGIEELQTSGRQEVADTLKPMITNNRIEVQAKGQDQRVIDNRANFLIFSNHKDAVLKTESDRRYAVFYAAQQEQSDLQRDGMTGDYFARLYGWLENGGYAHFAHYLATRPITVDVMGRAPVTSSTDEAIRSSAGVAEQLIQEAIDLEEFGFRGDLVCTKAAADYLRNSGKRLSPQRIVEVLNTLGFIKHPALESSAGKISIDGVRRRVYVKRGSLTAGLSTPGAVAEAWQRAQVAPCPTGGTVQPISARTDKPGGP